MSQNQIAEIKKFIESHRAFLITSHKDPDGDSIGSQLALYHGLITLGARAIIVNQGATPSKYKFLDSGNLISFDEIALPFQPAGIIVLECPGIDRLGFVSRYLTDGMPVVNIDHHLDNDLYGNYNWIDSGSCAVGEMIYYLFQEMGVRIDGKIAELLYAAILSDTGQFRFSSTSARGMKTASELIALGANPKTIADKIYSSMSPETIKLLGLILSRIKIEMGGRLAEIKVTSDDFRHTGAKLHNTEGFVNFLMSISGVQLGIFFKEIDKSCIKVSLRSADGIDAASLAKFFGGGGHFNAAGFTFSGGLDEAINLTTAKAKEYLNAN